MEHKDLQRIGRLGKTWGHLGDLSLQLDGVDPEELNGSGSFFLDIEGQLVPFFYTRIQEKGRSGTLIKFDEVDDPQAAAVLVGCDLYAPPGHFADGRDESWDPMEFVGLVVVDVVIGELGEVTAIEGTDDNPVLVVLHGEHEVLIPLAEDLVDRIDAEEGRLYMRTPPGLVDLYRAG
ncbi:MAG: hypothetical protein JNM31_10170 [Flavobacteriales bacterium]|nr:hypothetical protein [Flavobacteriales bacterium]